MSLIHVPAEMSVIGCMLLSRDATQVAIDQLTPEDFGSGFRTVFAELCKLHRTGKLAETIFVTGADDVMELAMKCAEFTPSAAGFGTYIDIVSRMSAKRKTRAAAESLIAEIDSEVDNWDTVVPQVKALGEMWQAGSTHGLLTMRDIPIGEDQRGVATGYGPIIDSFTGVGWVSGQTSVVSAYHKGGKTTFLLGSFRDCAARGLRAVYATFADLDPSQLKRRLLKQECGVGSYPKIRLDRAADFEDALAMVDDPLGEWANVRVYDSAKHGRDVEKFCGMMLAEHARERIDIIFADYIQKITSRDVGARFGKTAQVEHASEQLADLAGKLNCPVVMGSQVTKGEGGEWITKYARGIEEDAGFVLRVIREGDTDAKVVCAFNRFGRQDVEVPLRWNDDKVRFDQKPGARP
jgi:replicative DNA helicase